MQLNDLSLAHRQLSFGLAQACLNWGGKGSVTEWEASPAPPTLKVRALSISHTRMPPDSVVEQEAEADIALGGAQRKEQRRVEQAVDGHGGEGEGVDQVGEGGAG